MDAESQVTWERSAPQRSSGPGPAVCTAMMSGSRQDIPRLLWPVALYWQVGTGEEWVLGSSAWTLWVQGSSTALHEFGREATALYNFQGTQFT